MVNTNGIAPIPTKVEAITNYSTPTDRAGLERFLGMINYYRRFIPNAAAILTPLHTATSSPKSQPFAWSEECQSAFDKAKHALITATMLKHMIPAAELAITSDALDRTVGGWNKRYEVSGNRLDFSARSYHWLKQDIAHLTENSWVSNQQSNISSYGRGTQIHSLH